MDLETDTDVDFKHRTFIHYVPLWSLSLFLYLSNATFHTYLLAFIIFNPWVDWSMYSIIWIYILSSAFIKQVG